MLGVGDIKTLGRVVTGGGQNNNNSVNRHTRKYNNHVGGMCISAALMITLFAGFVSAFSDFVGGNDQQSDKKHQNNRGNRDNRR